jgi:putative transcriptional regulator
MNDSDFGVIEFKLKQVMDSRKMTLHQLANDSGLTLQTCRGLVGWVERFDRLTLAKLCYALKCQPGDLLEYRP